MDVLRPPPATSLVTTGVSTLLVFLMIGLVAAFLRWNATHHYLIVRAREATITVRLPVTPSLEYTPEVNVDVNKLLDTHAEFDVQPAKLEDELRSLFADLLIPMVGLADDVKGVRGAAVKGQLSYRAAFQMMLSGTRCRYEVVNNEIVLVWCKKRASLTRAPNSERDGSDSEPTLPLPPSDPDRPNISFTQVHPKGLQVDAYVDTQTLHVHIPAGDAQFTVPAWEAITRMQGSIDLPTKLIYDTKVIAGHHTRAVDGPLTDQGVLNTMLPEAACNGGKRGTLWSFPPLQRLRRATERMATALHFNRCLNAPMGDAGPPQGQKEDHE